MAVEVFDGNTADPATWGRRSTSCGIGSGSPGWCWSATAGCWTGEDVGLDWISALRGPAVRSLVESGAVQLSLFDETDLVEIRSGLSGRAMVCRNPLLAEERARKREALLRATEALLDPIVAAARREKRRLKGADKIGVRVGKVVGKYKMAKHFELDIEEAAFGYRRKPESIAAEAALDGLYVVASLPASGRRGRRARVQAPERGRARLPELEDRGPEGAARIPRTAESCACWPITWNGICASGSSRCCSTTTTRPPPRRRRVHLAPAQVSEAATEKARGKRTADAAGAQLPHPARRPRVVPRVPFEAPGPPPTARRAPRRASGTFPVASLSVF